MPWISFESDLRTGTYCTNYADGDPGTHGETDRRETKATPASTPTPAPTENPAPPLGYWLPCMHWTQR